ncbi:MAG: S8 family peptidase [Bryobacteraceae bacterium]
MKPRELFSFLLLSALGVLPSQAAGRFIVRINGGSSTIQAVCVALGCTVGGGLDGSLGQVFLVTTSDLVDTNTFLATLRLTTGVADAELDLQAHASQSGYTIPPALSDTSPVTYFGSTVPNGYVNQPATQIIRLSDTRAAFGVKGAGVVAVIDTGVDSKHPALQSVLVPGYDFTRNQNGKADETDDVVLSKKPAVNGVPAAWVNPNAVALVDQSTAAVVDGQSQYGDFGHGTMVAGLIHLIAPGAMIMPLKAFMADGTAYASDILRAIYRAVQSNANIINMSFNLAAYSKEVENAVNFANRNGVICVAAAGNNGQDMLVYPAGLSAVMAVASTTNDDQRSSFSNYGQNFIWIAAPGEGIVTTYPFGTYAAVWGTSFSTAFISGVAALMLDVQINCDQLEGAQSMAHAKSISPDLGNGRLDAFQAVQAWRQLLGMQ